MISKFQAVLFIFTMTVMFVTTGCSPQQTNNQANNQTKLTVADDNTQVTLAVGVRLAVALDCNPSTGYTWEVKNVDKSVLQQVGETNFESSNPGLIGAGGIQTLTFEAMGTGTTTLVLIYHRPWETDVEPLNTFTVTVTVQ